MNLSQYRQWKTSKRSSWSNPVVHKKLLFKSNKQIFTHKWKHTFGFSSKWNSKVWKWNHTPQPLFLCFAVNVQNFTLLSCFTAISTAFQFYLNWQPAIGYACQFLQAEYQQHIQDCNYSILLLDTSIFRNYEILNVSFSMIFFVHSSRILVICTTKRKFETCETFTDGLYRFCKVEAVFGCCKLSRIYCFCTSISKSQF